VEFKILSIDGGGIKGLYSARILECFEERFNCRLVDYFDMICGTSTGGLIALGLSLGVPAHQIAQFYWEKGPLIFPPHQRHLRLFNQLFGFGKYSNRTLRRVLLEIVGHHKIKDVQSLICIPSHSITSGRPYIFKYDHLEGKLGRDNNTPIIDVALATSAAPTYFPIVEIENHGGQFIDGGVAANNPAFIGLMEAMRFFVGEGKQYASTKILSIETVTPTSGMKILSRKRRSALHWREDLVTVFMEGQTRLADFALRLMSETEFVPCKYVRVESPKVSPSQAKLLSLDNASQASLMLLNSLGRDQAHIYAIKDEVHYFFENEKTYHIRS
jgi:patatin-like phospholipase/acyl hydrolase